MLIRLTTYLPDSASARLASDRLAEGDGVGEAALATSLFEEPGKAYWKLDAYYGEAPDEAAVLALIGELILPDRPTSLEVVPDENWVAISQAALPPVEAGRFLVHGSHDRVHVGRRQWALEIEAGEAFGTAHHATTQGCLEALDGLAHRRPPRRVLDLGCGSGVLAIAASRLWPGARLMASDIDPQATAVAAANAVLNRAGTRIAVVTATGLAHGHLRRAAPYDLIVANILAGPLIALAPAMARAVVPGGTVVLSGLLAEQARGVEGAYRMAGFVRRKSLLRHGWTTLVLALIGRRGRRRRAAAH